MAKFLKKIISFSFILLFVFVLAACQNMNNNKDDDKDDPIVDEPSIKDDYECITIAEAIALAEEAGESGTADKYYVYGTVKQVSNSVYGEMTIEDETGELYVYGVYSSDGNTRYDAMTERPVAGDEIVLYGMLKTYNGEPEMDRGYLQAFNHVEVEIDTSEYTEYTVDQVRELEAGNKVKVSGVVAKITYAFGYVPNGFYLVDNTGSIYVYGTETTAQVSEGNTVTIIGEKTYYISDSEKSAAEKHGYQGCCQIQNPQVIENDKLVSEFDKSWIEESTVKEIVETELSNNITTNIYKVVAYVNKVPGSGFTNYYINDLDNETGSYVYTACSGSDFTWLDQYNGKICTVYLSAINCKSTNAGCIYRFIPVLVEDEGYEFDVTLAPEFVLEYYVLDQFLGSYESNPAVEVITSVSNESLGFSDVVVSYESSNENVAYFEEVDGKLVFNTNNPGTTLISISALYEGVSSSVSFEVCVEVPEEYQHISVEEAINSEDGTEVILRGVVVSSLVNQYGFYLQDKTGIIAVCCDADDVALLSCGDEVIIRGTKSHKVKEGYTGKGQINVYNSEILVNLYGDHDYDTSKFITDKDANYFYKLNHNEDHSTEVYVMNLKVKIVNNYYYTSLKLVSEDGKTEISLYCSSADQYGFLKPYDGQVVTVELAACNWNGKSYYVGCVISITVDGTKIMNTLNFND